MTIKYLDSKRISVTGIGSLDGVGGWKEIGRHTIGTATANMDVSSLPDKRYYMVLIDYRNSGSISSTDFRFNGDSGNNYSSRGCGNGGSESAGTNMNGIDIWQDDKPHFAVFYIANKSDKEKLVTGHFINRHTSGAGNAPSRGEQTMKWVNTSSVINQISLIANSNAWTSGAELVVLGWDDSDTHTTNFWEELASVTSTSAGTSISSGTFTAKKYLWVQMYAPSGQSAINENFKWQFNGDTGNNYARRYSSNGGSDGTATTQDDFQVSRSGINGDFTNAFIINNSANEKLIIYHQVAVVTLGAGTAPSRQEGVGKWTNTSSQITSINISTASDSMPVGWTIKVWGHD